MKHDGWILIIYRVPTESSRARVAVWRDLKRMGGLYLQQCVCIFPSSPGVAEALDGLRSRIDDLDGTSSLFRIPGTDREQEERLIAGFRELAAKDYAEIVEECESKFVKEIEFERYRNNYTFEEAEEIRHDLEKIRRWFDRVVARDWFGTPGREAVEGWIERCEVLLEEFEEDVYKRAGEGEEAAGGPVS
jgi:DNA-binding transcriptional regulator PaaX